MSVFSVVSDTEVDSCPCCGGEGELRQYPVRPDIIAEWVQCVNCSLQTAVYINRDELLKVWKRRSEHVQ